MYSVHFVNLVLLLLCKICLAEKRALMSDLVPIHSRRLEIRGSHLGRGNPLALNGPCMHMKYESQTLFIDLYIEYPIHLIKVNGSVISRYRQSAYLFIKADNISQWSYNHLFTKNAEIFLNPVPSARVLTIKANAEISLCWVEAFACRPGKQGTACQFDCPKGYFGLGCYKSCQCPNDEVCDPITGICPQGCDKNTSSLPETCHSHLVGVAKTDFFSSIRAYYSTIIHGPTKDLKSSESHKTDTRCVNVTSQCNSKILYLELTTTKLISLYGVELVFSWFQVPSPYSVIVTIDEKPCYGRTIIYGSLPLGKNRFKCYREDIKGKRIRIQITTHNKAAFMNDDGVGVSMCDVRALDCVSGFHGTNCRRVCQCAGYTCDKMTGACPGQRCNGHASGSNCSALNIAYNTNIIRKHFESHVLHQTNLLDGGSFTSSAFHDKTLGRYISWLAVQLDYAYSLNSITLTFPRRKHDVSRTISVFTDPYKEVSSLDIRHRDKWDGVPCATPQIRQGRSSLTTHIQCTALARTLVLVEASTEPVSDLPAIGIKVWVCVDGTFGPHCEHQCNCQETTEVCDKDTGMCLTGCAKGFKGVNCLMPCVTDDDDPVCPTKTCHCWGTHTDDCGPVVPICTQGCQDGYMGIDCSLPCPRGFFGYNCDQRCGACRYRADDINGTCNHINGTCPHGCAYTSQDKATCRNRTVPHSFRTTTKRPDYPASRDSRSKAAVEASSFRVIMGLVGVIIACSSIVILVCCSLKCYWDRLAHTKTMNEKRVDMIMRRAMRAQMDNKVHKDHQQYHEEYIKRDLLKNVGHSVDLPDDFNFKGGKGKAKAEAIRRMIMEMESQRRMKYLGKPGGEDDDEEDEEQDPNEKVALWVINQDFNELIDRRRRRLKEYTGNPLTITESPYRISEVSVIKDIHRLYDDLEDLAIP